MYASHDFALLLQHTHIQAESQANGAKQVMLATFEWFERDVGEAETEFEREDSSPLALDENAEVPRASGPDAYASAKSKSSSRQATINATSPKHGSMDKWPNTSIDPNFAHLAKKSKIVASEAAALVFAAKTLPADETKSRMLTSGLDFVEGFASGRRIHEEKYENA